MADRTSGYDPVTGMAADDLARLRGVQKMMG
jgi:hypothetical protein